MFRFIFLWRCGPTQAVASSFLRFLDHTQRRITVGRTPLDEWSARRRDVYDTQHSQQTGILAPLGFETKISEGKWPQTYAIDRTATGTGTCLDFMEHFACEFWGFWFHCSSLLDVLWVPVVTRWIAWHLCETVLDTNFLTHMSVHFEEFSTEINRTLWP
jgi:hypothetical protein